jgi:hypothetical protein
VAAGHNEGAAPGAAHNARRSTPMSAFDSTTILVDEFIVRLRLGYERLYSTMEPSFPGIIDWCGRMTTDIIANSDALYHDAEHTMMVTLVGQEILRGKHALEGGVRPRDWLHFVLSLLCHDIGYVRGICPGDDEDVCVIGPNGETVTLPPGATDAFLTPYHVERGKLFIRTRFRNNSVIDPEIIAANIENTRFPVPSAEDPKVVTEYPGLVRAADLIGQLADPNYLRKLPRLFYEFEETGANARLGYSTPDDLRESYPKFFWQMVNDHIAGGLKYLRATQSGRQWIFNLYSHVFSEEHRQIL